MLRSGGCDGISKAPNFKDWVSIQLFFFGVKISVGNDYRESKTSPQQSTIMTFRPGAIKGEKDFTEKVSISQAKSQEMTRDGTI